VSKKFDALLKRIDDPELRAALQAEFSEATDNQRVGLVFEEHLPETVTLRTVRPRRGLKVRRRGDASDSPLMEVLRVRADQATCALPGDDDDADQVLAIPVDELDVVAEFGDPIYPGLREISRAEGPGADPSRPAHIVLNAENYHALQALQWSHAEAVDVIYIDPPYNLGGDLTYNDRRIGKEDAYRHSYWLSFMQRRLELARKLLKPTGIIIVAIDDTEHAHLKLLMDQVFHESNFIATVVWQGGHKNDSKYVSVGHDYMLIYAREESALEGAGVRWREKKPGLEESLAAARRIWEETGGNHAEATKRWRAWLKDLKAKGGVTDAVTRYNNLDETGRPIFTGGNLSWPGGGGPRYDLIHPVTGKPVQVPKPGWRYQPDRMAELIAQGRVRFGKDETSGVQGVAFLDEMDTQVAKSVFSLDRRKSANDLTNLLGGKRFTFPKDHTVLARWIDLVTQSNPDAVVLDFFAGSGSTAQAVMELNAADGGRRQSILVTNNEVDEKTAKRLTKEGHEPGGEEWERWGIFWRVTKPRIETVVTGIREDGSRYSDGLPEQVVFYELTYLDPERVRVDAAYEAVAPLLWIRTGAVGPVLAESSTHGFSVTERYGVLHDVDAWQAFAKALPETATTAFIVTDSPSAFTTAADALPTDVEKVRLYERYLSTFEINTGKGA